MDYSLKCELEKERGKISQGVSSTFAVVVSITLVVHRHIWFVENEVYSNRYFSTVLVCFCQQIRNANRVERKAKAN